LKEIGEKSAELQSHYGEFLVEFFDLGLGFALFALFIHANEFHAFHREILGYHTAYRAIPSHTQALNLLTRAQMCLYLFAEQILTFAAHHIASIDGIEKLALFVDYKIIAAMLLAQPTRHDIRWRTGGRWDFDRQ
jgi:hypothetical protein